MFAMFKKKENNPDDFWREYEEKTGEKVLARSLGQYMSGWEEFDANKWNAIWGLVIATSGGFRFHHFPHMGWLEALTRLSSGSEGPKEKTIFIPKEQLVSAELRKETRWWKKILSPTTPELRVRYRNSSGEEQMILLQAGFEAEGLAEQLAPSGTPEEQ